MQKNKALPFVIGFILFIVVVVTYTCGIILSSPVEIVGNTAGNFICNLQNDGYVLEDEGFLLFANSKGELFRAETNHLDEKKVKIADNCNGFIQVVDSTYYFLQNNNFVSCDFQGKNLKTVVENVKAPQICGSTVYFLNENNEINKYSMRYNTVKNLKIKCDGTLVIYFNRLYYSADDCIYSVATDGSDKKVFFDKPVSKFAIDNKYLFYTSNGQAYSAIATSDGLKSTKITKASDFAVIVLDGMMILNNDTGVYLADMNKLTGDEKYEPTQLCKTPTSKVFGDEAYFYWFNEKDELCRIAKDGSGSVIIK